MIVIRDLIFFFRFRSLEHKSRKPHDISMIIQTEFPKHLQKGNQWRKYPDVIGGLLRLTRTSRSYSSNPNTIPWHQLYSELCFLLARKVDVCRTVSSYVTIPIIDSILRETLWLSAENHSLIWHSDWSVVVRLDFDQLMFSLSNCTLMPLGSMGRFEARNPFIQYNTGAPRIHFHYLKTCTIRWEIGFIKSVT